MKILRILLPALIACVASISNAQPVIYINQVAFDSAAPKIAVIGSDAKLDKGKAFSIINIGSSKVVFTGKLSNAEKIDEWAPGKIYYRADFRQ